VDGLWGVSDAPAGAFVAPFLHLRLLHPLPEATREALIFFPFPSRISFLSSPPYGRSTALFLWTTRAWISFPLEFDVCSFRTLKQAIERPDMCSCREGSFSSPFHLVCLSYLFPLALPVLLQTGRPLEKAGGCTGYPSLFAAWPVNVPTGPRPALWGSGRAVEPVDWCVATSVTVGICRVVPGPRRL
jgi:hypothetical protein